jgi:adenylate kinase
MRIVFIGAPGAGKGTQASRLATSLGIPHLSTGEILRSAVDRRTSIGRLAAEYLKRGELVPDLVVVQIVGERLAEPDCAAGCLFDGFPRTLAQAEALDHLLAASDAPLDLVLELRGGEDLLIARLLARGRADDAEEIIRQRLVTYELQTLPLLEYYKSRGLLRSVDGEGTVEEVFERVRGAVDEVRQQKE